MEGLQFHFTAVCRRIYILFLGNEMLKRLLISCFFSVSPLTGQYVPYCLVESLMSFWPGLAVPPALRPLHSSDPVSPLNSAVFFSCPRCPLDISWASTLNITKPSHTAPPTPTAAPPGLASADTWWLGPRVAQARSSGVILICSLSHLPPVREKTLWLSLCTASRISRFSALQSRPPSFPDRDSLDGVSLCPSSIFVHLITHGIARVIFSLNTDCTRLLTTS